MPLYRYQRHFAATPPDTAQSPVLLVHPLPPETGSALAQHFLADGLTELYTFQVAAVDDTHAAALRDAIDWLLETHYPGQEQVVLIGCVTGGALARRYVLQGGHRRAAYLFLIGTAHEYSPLAGLPTTVFTPYQDRVDVPVCAGTACFDQTVIVNLYSETMLRDPDAPGYGVHLPEAINVGVPLQPEALCRHLASYRVLRHHLRGQYWRVSVRLQALTMRAAAADGTIAPFCFEVNGQRAPFDGAFTVQVGTPYTFDPASTPLGTLTVPLTQSGRAADIAFRLKDLGTQRAHRRKLLTSLHIALGPDRISEHVLQDSRGSEIHIQVRCDQPPAFLPNESA